MAPSSKNHCSDAKADDLARAWLRWISARWDIPRHERQEDLWAMKEVQSLLADDPERCWQVVGRLIDCASSKNALRFVGRLALGDLVLHHYQRFEERICAALQSDQRFLYVLTNVSDSTLNQRPRLRELMKISTLDLAYTRFDQAPRSMGGSIIAVLCVEWHRFWSESPEERRNSGSGRAFDEVAELVFSNPELCWEIMIELLETATSTEAIFRVSRCVLAPLLQSYFDDFSNSAVAEFGTNEKFRLAIEKVDSEQVPRVLELTTFSNSN